MAYRVWCDGLSIASGFERGPVPRRAVYMTIFGKYDRLHDIPESARGDSVDFVAGVARSSSVHIGLAFEAQVASGPLLRLA
jgi:hypothetical protein